MPDFERYVRERLGRLELGSEKGADREAEIVQEIAEHLRAAYQEALEQGESEGDALHYAESPFVPWDALRGEIARAEGTAERGVFPGRWRLLTRRAGFPVGPTVTLANLWQDLRFGLRTLRKRPLFTTMAIATLGLGIGATTTMFSVVDGVLLRHLSFDRPGELVTILWERPGRVWRGGWRWGEFLEIREHRDILPEVAAHRLEGLTLTGSGNATGVIAGVTTASLFPLLGVRPQLGRLFQEGEDGPGARPVVVLSGEIWQTRFGSDPSVIGRTITLAERPYEVIGVLPAGFRLRSRPENPGREEIEHGVDTGERDVWLPVGFQDGQVAEWAATYEVVVRLRSGGTLAQARAEAEALLRQSDEGIRLAPLEEVDRAGLSFPLFLLLGAAGVLALVACANVANLLISESVGRHHEMTTRVALGASRRRLIRQLLVESVLLGLGGSLLGLGLAIGGVRAVSAFGPYLPGLESVAVDYRVFLFAVSLGVATGLIFGLFPALRSARISPSISRRGGNQRGARLVQHQALGMVFALTTVLLIAGGLLTRSFWNLVQLDIGFRADGIATVRLPLLPAWRENLEVRNTFYTQVIEEIEAIPGVIQASGADNLPFPGARSGHMMTLPGEEEGLQTPLRRVLPDYHEVMGIPLVAGRGIEKGDVLGSTPVVVVSEAVARHFWPGESAIGATLNHRMYGDLTVVGVVGEVVEGWVNRQAQPMVYLPLLQTPQEETSLLARTNGDPTSIIPQMREAVWAVDPDVAVAVETTMESLVADSNLNERYRSLLVMFFGISATLLAAVGIFGVTARGVAQRARELGIRVALGAQGGGLVTMVVRESLTTALAGTAIGLLAALWASRLLTGFLFGVEPLDPLTFTTVASLLCIVCLAAAYLPSRRIVQLDPMTVLKAE